MARRDSPHSAALKAAVRDLLRFGAYKPTGRGKPASEYLLNAAAEGTVPLREHARGHQQPRFGGEPSAHLSRGPGSRRTQTASAADGAGRGSPTSFNPSGQVLDLRDLLLLLAHLRTPPAPHRSRTARPRKPTRPPPACSGSSTPRRRSLRRRAPRRSGWRTSSPASARPAPPRASCGPAGIPEVDPHAKADGVLQPTARRGAFGFANLVRPSSHRPDLLRRPGHRGADPRGHGAQEAVAHRRRVSGVPGLLPDAARAHRGPDGRPHRLAPGRGAGRPSVHPRLRPPHLRPHARPLGAVRATRPTARGGVRPQG